MAAPGRIALALVLASLALPTASASAQDTGAWTRRLDLAHGAYDHDGAAPDAIVHAPAGFD
ncbi:MAG: hypothetical protein M3Y87_36565, partial [Myxococcota bacterium]|nr:hypothetical protein [Myxococcota bacterium]